MATHCNICTPLVIIMVTHTGRTRLLHESISYVFISVISSLALFLCLTSVLSSQWWVIKVVSTGPLPEGLGDVFKGC